MMLLLFFSVAVASAKVSLALTEGQYSMYTRPVPVKTGAALAPIAVTVAGSGSVTLTAMDIDEKPVAWTQSLMLEDGKPQTIHFPAPSLGYYRLAASANGVVESTIELGIIPPPHPGMHKESFFCSNSWLKTGKDLLFLQSLGIKVQRTHFQGVSEQWRTSIRSALAENIAHDTWVLPIVGYAFEGRVAPMGVKLNMYGPPDDLDAFVADWEKIMRAFPELTTFEFWNEPWIYGWTWAGSPAEYRTLQKKWCEMARRVNPKVRIIAGNSWMFVEDHIEQDPACWKGLLDGTTHHPYLGIGNANQRSGENCRTIDGGFTINRRMGLPYYYLTEGGAFYAKPLGEGKGNTFNNRENARNVVTYMVRSALCGAYQTNAQWEIGYGPTWTMPNTTLAVLTHAIEDRPIVADLWPHHELINGAIFANPRFITPAVKALPRATEISVRWDVPIPQDRARDTTKVAVIWSLTGTSNDNLDAHGALTIANAKGLKAYDMVGRDIPATHGKLIVPFTSDPVYITSDTLSVIALKDRITGGTIGQVTPLNMYAFSLMQPADRAQTLSVRMENQLNIDIAGTLTVQVPGTPIVSRAPFAIPAGKLVEVPVAWPGTAITANNRYGIILSTALAPARKSAAYTPVVVSQAISTAQFVKRTITVDGTLADWQGVTPVTILPPGKAKIDLTEYLLNPNRPMPQNLVADVPKDSVKVYAAYDAHSLYIAIDGWGTDCSAGKSWRDGTPFKQGTQDGLNYITLCGDYVQLAFGFRDRVPGYGRQMDDPLAWKGHFYDTDYLYSAHTSTEGDILDREWGPNTTRGTAYQTVAVPGRGAVPGAKIKIVGRVYEMAIPRSELTLFDPARMDRFRFSVLMNNGAMCWSETAGIFDHWMDSSSFGPSWLGHYPNQTYFGIEK